MKLRFIGKDGSMGLEHNNIYNVKISTSREYIIVEWSIGKATYGCPYPSLAKLRENWADLR